MSRHLVEPLHLQGTDRPMVAPPTTRAALGTDPVATGGRTSMDRERADDVYSPEQIARDQERLMKAWDDIVIAMMELDFVWESDE